MTEQERDEVLIELAHALLDSREFDYASAHSVYTDILYVIRAWRSVDADSLKGKYTSE